MHFAGGKEEGNERALAASEIGELPPGREEALRQHREENGVPGYLAARELISNSPCREVRAGRMLNQLIEKWITPRRHDSRHCAASPERDCVQRFE